MIGLESLQMRPQRCAGPFSPVGNVTVWETSSHQTGFTGILALDVPASKTEINKFVDKPLRLWYFCYNTKVLIIMQFAEIHSVLRKTGSGYSTWPG